MKSLFEESAVAEVMERLDALRSASERRWGKMSPAQALAHCSAAMEMAIGERRPPRVLIGRLIGPLFIICGNSARDGYASCCHIFRSSP